VRDMTSRIGRKRVAGFEQPQGLTIRQFTMFLLAMVLVFVLVPVGSWAKASFDAFITDPVDPANQARVDADGNLQVTGDINSMQPVATSSRNETFDVAAQGFEQRDIEPIDASLITVTGGQNSVGLFFSNADGVGFRLEAQGGNTVGSFVTFPLTQPIPIDHLAVTCFNQSSSCSFEIDIVGA
jgi:hypothetical protein